MKFLANENFPAPSIRILRKLGYFVESITENTHGVSDEYVLETAVLHNYIILTFDRDYGELIYKYKRETPPSVVYFRTKGNNPEDAANLLLKIIENKSISIENTFTVVENDGIRQRKLKA